MRFPHFPGVKRVRNEKLLMMLGKNVVKHRKSQGLSQNQLAFEAGMPIPQINRLERGKLNITVSTLDAIAQTLDLDIKDLFDFSDISD